MSEKNRLPDLKNLASYICAGIATLLGVPFLVELAEPYLWDLVEHQYPEAYELVYWLVKAGIYVLSFALLQSMFYLAVTMAVTAISAHALRFAL